MTPTDLWRQWCRAIRTGDYLGARKWGAELRLCKTAPAWSASQCSAFRVWWAVRGMASL